MSPRRPLVVRVLLVLGALLALLFAASTTVPSLRPREGAIALWDIWVYNAVPVVALALLVVRGRRVRAERAAWLWLAAGLATNVVGSVLWNVVVVPGGEPYPSISDVFWLSMYPCFYVGFVLLARARARGFAASAALDGVVSGLAAAAVVSAAVLGTLVGVTADSAVATVVNLAYPAADVLLALLLFGAWGARTTVGAGAVLLAAALMLWAGADAIYLVRAAEGTYVDGTVLDSAWVFGSLLIGAAAWPPDRALRPTRVARVPPLAIPVVSALVALVVLVSQATEQDDRIVTSVLAAGAVVAALARAAVALREAARLGEVTRLARTDELTGAANRRGVLEAIREEIRRGRPVALVLFDLRRFGEVNDALGHAGGDALLQAVTERFAAPTAGGVLGRLSADEFGIVVPAADAEAVAARLHLALEDALELGEVPVAVEGSAGIARHPEDARDAAGLLRAATRALREAKRAGSETEAFRAELDQRPAEQLVRAGEVHRGILRGEVEAHVQPQLDLFTGALVGVEALARWRRDGELVPPGAWLPLVERTTVVRHLTDAVLADLLPRLGAWRAEGVLATASVNLAGPDLTDRRLPERVARALQAAGVPPAALVLEATEDAVMADVDRAAGVLAELRELGVAIALDDFGTGHASLGMLKALPLDELKLDRGFVATMQRDHRDRAVVDATLHLASRFGLRMVAEGIEDPETWAALRDAGATVAQGFLVARPMPADELATWAAAWAADRPAWARAGGIAA